MPVFTFDETIPKDRAFSDAIEKTLKLCPGILTKAIINIPAGVWFLARFQILDGLFNVLPSTEGQYYTGESSAESVDLWYPLEKEPFELTWKLWNLDDTYTHELILKLTVLPKEVAENVRAIRELTNEVRTLQRILTGLEPGPLTSLQVDLAKIIALLPTQAQTSALSKVELKQS